MKILVTGYKGFIGQNMVASLKNNHNLSLMEWGDNFPSVKSHDWVIHLGAISSTTETDIEKIMIQNYDFTCRLFNQCARQGVNIQYASSASLYGFGKEFSENSQLDPRTPYAWSKLLCEREARKYSNILIQGFRYFNVYGPHEDHKGTQASPFHQFSKQFETTGQVRVFTGSEKYCRDFIHVDQIIKTHTEFFRVKESGVWNVGTGKTMSFLDVAKTFTNNITEIPFPDYLRKSYQEYTCADMTSFENMINKYNLKM